MIAMEGKELHGYQYAVHNTALLDTVPAAFAEEWLASAPQADTLILCGANPYPKTVQYFLNERPNGTVYAPHYTAYMLEGILGETANIQLVRDRKTIGDITLTVVSQKGKGSRLTADCGQAGLWPDAKEQASIAPELYNNEPQSSFPLQTVSRIHGSSNGAYEDGDM